MSNETELSFTFTFTSRASYLDYRAAWKAEYKQLSKDIRTAKLEFKNAQREGRYVSHWALRGMQERATMMLAERAASKIEAQRQYLAARQATAAPTAA